MPGKVCLVTGATSGIGLETSKGLAARGVSVVLVGRSRERGEAALEQVRHTATAGKQELLFADLSSQAQVRQLAAQFAADHDRLDLLVNNAGGVWARRQLTEDGLEQTFAVDHLAPFLLTNLLLGLLRASAPARVVTVASEAHRGGRLDLDDPQGERRYSGVKAYCQAKLANVLFTQELARRLEGTGVAANAVHPGAVRTRFYRTAPAWVRLGAAAVWPALVSPRTGAARVLHVACAPELERVTGQYFVRDRPARPSREARDPELARRLWDASAKLTGLA